MGFLPRLEAGASCWIELKVIMIHHLIRLRLLLSGDLFSYRDHMHEVIELHRPKFSVPVPMKIAHVAPLTSSKSISIISNQCEGKTQP